MFFVDPIHQIIQLYVFHLSLNLNIFFSSKLFLLCLMQTFDLHVQEFTAVSFIATMNLITFRMTFVDLLDHLEQPYLWSSRHHDLSSFLPDIC